jgi:putative transposase
MHREVPDCVNFFPGLLGREVVELYIKADHVHLISNVASKISISHMIGTVKGWKAIRVLKQFPYLKQKLY